MPDIKSHSISLEQHHARRYFQVTNRLDYFELPPDIRRLAASRHPERAVEEMNRRMERDRERQSQQCNTAQSHNPTNAHPHDPNRDHSHTGDLVTDANKNKRKRVRDWGEETPHSEEGDDSERRRPYWMHKIVQAEQEERKLLGITPKDYGKRWRSTIWSEIGEAPVCGPADHAQAETFWYRIVKAIDKAAYGSDPEEGGWSPSERVRLYQLEKKWRKRKDGLDPRFEVVGTLRGTPGPRERREIHDRLIEMEMMEMVRRAR